MHQLMHNPRMINYTAPSLVPHGAILLGRAPLLAMGTLNSQKQIWTTVWGGEPGFTHPLRSSIIGVSSIVDASCDPVIETLFERDGQLKGEEEHQAHEVAALTIDLATRSRVKLAGKVLAGEITRRDDDNQKMAPIGEMQLAVKIDSSLGTSRYANLEICEPSSTSADNF